MLFNLKKGVNDLRLKENHLERKLGRKAKNFSLKEKKEKEESAAIIVAGIMEGFHTVLLIFDQINEFVICDEKNFTEGNIWEYASKEDKELLLGRIKELKSFLGKIEKKAK